MARNIQHALLTTPAADVRARQRFVLQLKREVERLRKRAAATARPANVAAPTTEAEAIEQLYSDEVYRTVCALKLTGQEMMWDSIDASLSPELPRLEKLFSDFAHAPDRKGSLSLDPTLDPGETWRRARVHMQPDGYQADRGPTDLRAGALYEEGGALYSRGQSVGTRESKAECAIRFINEWKPDFAPKRILDIGCSAGSSAIPYALAFPDAEVHAIDLFPGLLRYAHAKAESVGAAVHFHQMDTAATSFPDGHFDLVVSHNAMHEMSDATRAAMFTESYRILTPGGLCVHQDLPIRSNTIDVARKADLMFDLWFNGELYWADYLDCDCETYLDKAGFPQDTRNCGSFEQLDKSMTWYFAAAQKPETSEVTQ